jgi:hypothetical protein
MTNTPIPQEVRRSIVALANSEYERIVDFSMQIAFDNCGDLPYNENDEDANEEAVAAFGLLIANAIISRMKLQGMLAVIS